MPTLERKKKKKFGIFCIQNFCIEILSWMTEIWMENHLVSDSKCNIVNLECPKSSTRNEKIMSGSHLVSMTLHGRLTISIEQAK